MARRSPARRYAQAVFALALEKQELARWQSDLKKMVSLAQDATLVSFLESPRLSFEDKAKLLSARLGEVNPLALNLAHLLVARGRLGMIGSIAKEYQHLWDSYRGIERAEVATAIPLEDEERLKLGERLEAFTGKKIVLEPKVDASLIGGFRARIGDKLIDGSTRQKLIALKKELSGTTLPFP